MNKKNKDRCPSPELPKWPPYAPPVPSRRPKTPPKTPPLPPRTDPGGLEQRCKAGIARGSENIKETYDYLKKVEKSYGISSKEYKNVKSTACYNLFVHEKKNNAQDSWKTPPQSKSSWQSDDHYENKSFGWNNDYNKKEDESKYRQSNKKESSSSKWYDDDSKWRGSNKKDPPPRQ